MNLQTQAKEILSEMGVDVAVLEQGNMEVTSPVSGEVLARVKTCTETDLVDSLAGSREAFEKWRNVPPPRRGELIRLLGEELRKVKSELGRLVSIEVGKIVSEGLGEVQEMIDICDFAVGLSRQLYGLTIATERPGHRMMETWHPLGPVGIITAFNFPVAVWSWNAAIALVCGNPVIWKPSEKSPLTALACEAVFNRALARFGGAPEHLMTLAIGHSVIGQRIVDAEEVPLVSATGSTSMGRKVGPRLAGRFARSILELGGNNAAIICPSADLDMAVRAIAFSAMGTAGQRCTSLRRLFVHDEIYDNLVPRLREAYKNVTIGNPLEDEGNLVGPLIDELAFNNMQSAIDSAVFSGGVCTGGERINNGNDNTYYVRPALIEMPEQTSIVMAETFAPILYVMKYSQLSDAICMQNAVGAGLSSSIFTTDLREAELFLGAEGSDCGIANVNIGPSGAEIGGAFGGEKETGGGRESGSDAWKAYMRRATNTINYSRELPLAQGVTFDI